MNKTTEKSPEELQRHYDNCAMIAFIGTIIPTVGYFLTKNDLGGVFLEAIYVFTLGIPIAIVCLILAISGLRSNKLRILAILSLVPYAIIIVMILVEMFQAAFIYH